MTQVLTGTKARACGTKQRHTTPRSAYRHLDALVRRGADRNSLNVYRCKRCGFLHVGHRPGHWKPSRADITGPAARSWNRVHRR